MTRRHAEIKTVTRPTFLRNNYVRITDKESKQQQ